jgi:excisionase family DNA binding protein
MSPKKKPKAAAPSDLLTIDEAMAALRVSRRKIYMLAAQGRLDLLKFDHGTRVSQTSLDRLIAEITSTPWAPAAAKKGSAT